MGIQTWKYSQHIIHIIFRNEYEEKTITNLYLNSGKIVVHKYYNYKRYVIETFKIYLKG